VGGRRRRQQRGYKLPLVYFLLAKFLLDVENRFAESFDERKGYTMVHARLNGMIILFVLLISHNLYADCRWVLWEKIETHTYNLKTEKDTPWQPEWNAIEDMQTGADCARASDKDTTELAKRLKSRASSDTKIEILGSSVHSVTRLGGKDGSLMMMITRKLACYPGGLDPRPAQER
jgi:hypothetical protein